MLIGQMNETQNLQGTLNAQQSIEGVISSAELIGGQIVGMRGAKGEKGDKGDAGAADYNELTSKPLIEGVVLEGNKTFSELNLEALSNTEIEELLNNA